MFKVIDELKNSLEAEDVKGIALDIDETLSHTVQYWFSRMQNLFGNPENLTVTEMITKYRYSYKVPYWQTQDVHEWIEVQLHSNEVQVELPLIKGAVDGVNELNKIVPVVAYITARPDSVYDGTVTWLENHKFPRVPVLTRPDYVEPRNGNKWKAAVLEHLQQNVVAIVDDNPGLIEHFTQDYNGTVFLYNYTEQLTSNATVIPCESWDDVLTKVSQTFNK